MDPRENRLSASFGAVLEHAPDLALALASQWFGAVDGDVAVGVQRRIAGGWIDVEMTVGPAERPNLRLWIEAKHGAGLSGPDQINRYLTALAGERAARRILLLLAPIDFEPGNVDLVRVHERSSADDRPRIASWQELFVLTTDWRAGRANAGHSEWLVDEFLRFMEEEGLKEEPLTREHVMTLNRAAEATEALASVLRRGEQLITAQWGPRKAPRNPGYLADEYFVYDVGANPATAIWGDADLQWECESTEVGHLDTTIWAGLHSSESGPLGVEGNDSWITGLETEGFRYDADRKDRWLGRSMPIAALADLPTAEEQASRLAQFVIEAFRAATATNPPH